MASTVTLEGLSDLENALVDLSKTTARNVLLRVATAALQPMADLADQLAPSDPSTSSRKIKGNIAVSSQRKASTATQFTPEKPSTVTVYMGPTKDAYPEAMLEEFGVKPHVIRARKKSRLRFYVNGDFKEPLVVHHPGQKPRPYMRPAFEQEGVPTIERVGQLLGGEIQKASDRAARKAARQAAKLQGG